MSVLNLAYLVVVGALAFGAAGCALAGEELSDAGVIRRDTNAPDDAEDSSAEAEPPVDAVADVDGGPDDAGDEEAPPRDLDGSSGDGRLDAAAEDEDADSADAGEDASMQDESMQDATVAEATPDEGTLEGDSADAMTAEPMGDGGADAAVGEAEAEDADADAGVGEPPTMSACASGVYEGTFEGNLRATIGLIVIRLPPVTGEVQLFASESEEGGALLIEDGTLSAVDNEGDSVYARLSGVVNCETGLLEEGRLTHGVYRREALDQTVEFEGTVAGMYEHEPVPRVVGTWAVDGRFESGKGTFEVRLKGAAP